MEEVSHLIRIILYVQDMDRMVRFYRDVMGLTVKAPQGLDSYRDEFWVELETGACILTLHGGGEGRLGADSPKLSFSVSQIDGVRAKLIQKGAELGEVRSPAPGVRVCDGLDPEGNKFSLDAHA